MTLDVAGTSVVRRDLEVKLTGEARYTADLKLPGMLYGAILRSPHPHAVVLSVDTTEALRLNGVRAVVTPFDVPPGRMAPDMGILDTRVRFVGDEVAVVAADDPDTARAAVQLLRVQYAVLPHYSSPEASLAPDAVAIHPDGNLALGQVMSLERGSVADGFAAAEVVLEDDFEIPTHSATPLEPRAALASWGEDDDTDLTVWKTTRGVHVDRDALASALGLPASRVRVIGPFLGAGYGNKDETRLAGIAAVLSQRAGRPVRVELSREDEFVAGRVRHAARIHLRAGFRSDGSITAIEARALLDTGAYLASGAGVTRRAGQGILYLYHCANVRYEAHLAYTNRPTAGSYRALGAPQGHFALESLMDRAAGHFGMDPLDFRLRNHVRPEGQPGQRVTPADQVIDSQPLEGGIPFSSNGLQQCLELGSDAFGWRDYRPEQPADPALKRGRGMSMMIYRGGPGSLRAGRSATRNTRWPAHNRPGRRHEWVNRGHWTRRGRNHAQPGYGGVGGQLPARRRYGAAAALPFRPVRLTSPPGSPSWKGPRPRSPRGRSRPRPAPPPVLPEGAQGPPLVPRARRRVSPAPSNPALGCLPHGRCPSPLPFPGDKRNGAGSSWQRSQRC